MTSWLVGWWLVGWLAGWLVGWLVGWWLVASLPGLLFGWYLACLHVYYLSYLLAGLTSNSPSCLFACFFACLLACWLGEQKVRRTLRTRTASSKRKGFNTHPEAGGNPHTIYSLRRRIHGCTAIRCEGTAIHRLSAGSFRDLYTILPMSYISHIGWNQSPHDREATHASGPQGGLNLIGVA